MRSRAALAAVAAVALLVPGSTMAGSPSPAPVGYRPGTIQLTLEPWATGLVSPVFLTGDGTGDGRMYAVEQGGTIRVIDADGTVQAAPFLDISGQVLSGGEQGLLGLAFHPGYATNGRFFVYYTASDGNSQVLSEFHATDGVADPGSERVILQMADFAPNHNGGMLAFDPTGMLLIGTGDGGGRGDPQHNGQDVTQLLGKLLRIDVDGAQPYTTPENDPAGLLGPDARPEILATGLRNPWRYSVDPSTGAVFIGDVGQDRWEEVDVLPAGTGGANYGWSEVEGPECYRDGCDLSKYVAPVASYSHDTGACAIVGGYVYRGSAFPALDGAYVYGDYCSSDIWLLSAADALAGTQGMTGELVGHLDGNLSAFGRDDAGELYAVDLAGRVLRVVPTNP